MTEYTEIKGDNQTSAVRNNARKILELIDDPRGRKNTSNFIYNSDPRTKSADFGSYPIIYLTDYNLETDNVNMGGNLFNKLLTFEFHVVINDDDMKQKEWGNQLSDQLLYDWEYNKAAKLSQHGVGQPEIVRSNRVDGIDRNDQPVIRREFEVQAPTQIDMEQVDGEVY